MCDQYNPLEIRYIGYTDGYFYDNEIYDIHFPEKWAMSHKPYTGPKECENCAFFGSIGGHFFGYCVNCAEYEYNFERGPGLYDYYTEFTNNDHPSIFETYMKGVKLENIGDKDMNTDEFNENIQNLLEERKKLQLKIDNGWHPLDEK